MRFLLVDRIVEFKPGQSITGVKSVSMSEDFLEFHFPKVPVMPGVLLLEALVQLAGWLQAASSDYEHWFLLQKVERCMFYDFSLPGDRVELQVQAQSIVAEDERAFTGVCLVDGKKRMVAEFSGKVVRLEDIENVAAQKKHFQFLTRSGFSP